MKEIYIDFIEKVFGAYTNEHIKIYTDSVRNDGLKEHGYPRLVANLGILIAHGRKTELKDDFIKMMDLCCDEMPTALAKAGFGAGNDFSVKEIILSILEIEKNNAVEKEITKGWREKLSKLDVEKTYSCIAPVPAEPIMNWAAFGAASEQLRKYAGIGDESAFIDNQIESQLFSFDENGMYRDPNEPMVYDFVTRLQLAVAVWFGYEGKNYEKLMEYLMRSADITLKMQSVTGEIPYGGRSNQCLHNETFYAALCEFYASLLKKQGDLKKAGMFKRAARIAMESVTPWLNEEKMSHIKNRYPWEDMHGCEGYAYFDKYMITAGSWAYIAYAMADDEIEEVQSPAENENYIVETSEYFHKVFLKYKDYTVQFDTNADFHYDSNGIGRIHKKGVPSALCLSVPFAKEPNYKLDIKNPSDFSICGGAKKGEEFVYGFEKGIEYKLTDKKVTEEYAEIVFECKKQGEILFKEKCVLSGDGVEISLEGEGELKILFPVFNFDGKYNTEIFQNEKDIEVKYFGHKCNYKSNNILNDEKLLYANRNGHYKAFSVTGNNAVSLKIEIE